jgi:hypothetical protein
MSLPSGEVFTQVNRADAEDPFQDTDMMLYSYRTSPTSFAFDVAINSKSVFHGYGICKKQATAL